MFPSGTYVRLESQKSGRFINMYVRASSSDLEKTEGNVRQNYAVKQSMLISTIV